MSFLMAKASNLMERLTGYFLVIGLAGGSITNVLLYYLGMHNTGFRHIFYIAISVIIFVIAWAGLVKIFLSTASFRSSVVLVIIYPATILLLFGISYVLFEGKALRILDYIIQFFFFCVPAYLFGIDTSINHRERQLLKAIEIITLFYIPFAVKAIYSLYSPNKITGRIAVLGELNYMDMAYAFLLPICFLLICIVLMPDKQFSGKLILKCLNVKRRMMVYAGLALLYWLVILGTGTRGAMCCVLGLLIILMSWTVYIKSRRLFLRAVAIFLGFLMVFILFIFVIKSDYTQDAVYSWKLFISNALQGEFITSETETITKAELDKVISMNINEVTWDLSKVVMNREQLYYAARREFTNNPVIGLGPLGFNIKYYRYPHNIVLEVLCNNGLIGTIIILGVIAIALFQLLKAARQDVIASTMMFLFIGMNLPLLVSSSFIIWSPFWFFLGYTYNLTRCSVSNI